MAQKTVKIDFERYPRIDDPESRFHNHLDDQQLVPHKSEKISNEKLKEVIWEAIKSANIKSSRTILSLPEGITPEQEEKIYEKEGKSLLEYFRKYCQDPASTSFQVHRRDFQEVGTELFRNKTVQRERMNSGWRYQYLARKAAQLSRRFLSVSDISTQESDFNAVINQINTDKQPLTLYVSVKNRSNTMGGADWPNAIKALELHAKQDKNKEGSYLCVFGLVMERGQRNIKSSAKTKLPYSYNTEIWYSDFFWPFFTNFSYEEIMTAVLEVLIENNNPDELLSDIQAPKKVLEYFGKACRELELIDEAGIFNDPFRLVQFFCRASVIKPQQKTSVEKPKQPKSKK